MGGFGGQNGRFTRIAGRLETAGQVLGAVFFDQTSDNGSILAKHFIQAQCRAPPRHIECLAQYFVVPAGRREFNTPKNTPLACLAIPLLSWDTF